MSHAFIDGLGATLAQAREVHGLSQADAAQRLKLSARQIEAIETEDWSHLPGEVFLRGFVRNYARLLELNPEELIRPVDRDATVTTTITAPSEGLALGRSTVTRWVALPLIALLLFLLVVAMLYQWLSEGEQTLVPPPGQVAVPAAPPAESAAAAQVGTEAGTQAATEAANQTGAAASRTDTVIQPLPLDPQPLATPPVPPASVVPGAAGAEVAPGQVAADARSAGGTLRFVPEADSWIQVVDGQGQRFSKLVRAGVPELLSGQPPFKLVVGNAAQVKLSYNGHQIDLTPFIGEKVARLTLE